MMSNMEDTTLQNFIYFFFCGRWITFTKFILWKREIIFFVSKKGEREEREERERRERKMKVVKRFEVC